MNYRQHSGNETGSRLGLRAILNRWKLISSGWYRKQILTAYNLTEKTGYKSPQFNEFGSIINSKDTILRKLRYILFVWKYGRRKTLDRLVLAIAILFAKI